MATVEDDLYLSEMHVSCSSNASYHITSFQLRFLTTSSSTVEVQVDSDGDLVLVRKPRKNNKIVDAQTLGTVCIGHSMKTSLSQVGLQIWRGSLLLADFIIQNRSIFGNATALELGAGTGLAGIVASIYSPLVFITDIGSDVLQNCQKNVELNSEVFGKCQTARVRSLDWRNGWPPMQKLDNCLDEFGWTREDINKAEEASYLLAADVIYDEGMTDSLFLFLNDIMVARSQKKTLFLSLEKRYNFSMMDLDVVANGYNHFRGKFQAVSHFRDSHHGVETRAPSLVGKLVDTDLIEQFVEGYGRGKDLELWEIRNW